MTNADNIRGMSDQELVHLIVHTTSDGCPPEMDWECAKEQDPDCGYTGCEKCWEKWLKLSADIDVKFTQCSGEGQGSCKRCTDNGKWNRNWMCFLYKIDGLDGCYCYDCVKEIIKERRGGV